MYSNDIVRKAIVTTKEFLPDYWDSCLAKRIVGGAGSLYTNKEHTETVASGPDFPHDWLPVANAMADSLNALRKRNDVHWTYLSPAANFVADGEATGQYAFAGEEFTLNKNNESTISYADYASAMLDVIENCQHDKERISVYAD